MASVNKTFLLGNLTRDPELRHTPGGAAVCDLGLAVNRVWFNKAGEKQEEVLFVDVTVWNKTAENCARFLSKGKPVHVEGHMKLETWEDKTSGEKKSKIKVEADAVQFLNDGKPRDGVDEAPAQRPAATRQARPTPPPMDDSDLPF